MPEPQKRSGKKSKLDPFKPYILEKFKGGPDTAARLYRGIKEMVFEGGKTIVRTSYKKSDLIQKIPAVLRYETKKWGKVIRSNGEKKTGFDMIKLQNQILALNSGSSPFPMDKMIFNSRQHWFL